MKTVKAKKLTLRQQLDLANMKIENGSAYIKDMEHKIALLERTVSHLRVTERNFAQLLDGMCMGMKEANLPRRPG